MRDRDEAAGTGSPEDSPLLRDTPNTSRPKDKGQRKEQEEKQELEKGKTERKGDAGTETGRDIRGALRMC